MSPFEEIPLNTVTTNGKTVENSNGSENWIYFRVFSFCKIEIIGRKKIEQLQGKNSIGDLRQFVELQKKQIFLLFFCAN